MMQVTDERFELIERIILMYAIEKKNNPMRNSHVTPKRICNKMGDNLDDMEVDIREQEVGYVLNRLDYVEQITQHKYHVTDEILEHDLVAGN